MFLLAVLLLVAVMLINTVRFTSQQVQVTPSEPIELDETALAQRLAGAIRLQTISQATGQVNREVLLGLHAYLAQMFHNVHASLTKEIISDYSLLYTWPGQDATLKPLLLSAHLDVVPAEDEASWTHPPFAGAIAYGYIWGRGAMGDKAGVLGILEAEETGGADGATQMAALLQTRKVAFEYALDEGFFITDGILPGISRPVALIGIAEKGILNLELSVTGQSGHSSTPPAQTAISILSTAIRQLESHPMPGGMGGALGQMFAAVGPEMPFLQRLIFANRWLFQPLIERQLAASPGTNALMRTTNAVTLISGGVKENVLPGGASAVVNLRIVPGDSIAGVTAYVQATIADAPVSVVRYGSSASEPSVLSSTDAFGYQTLQQTIRQVFLDVLVAPGQVVGGTDARHYAALTENIYRFLPQHLRTEDVARIHGRDERLAVADYADSVRFYGQLLRKSTQQTD